MSQKPITFLVKKPDNANKKPLIYRVVLNGGAEVTKLELIINKFIEKVRTFEMFELGRMIDCINSRKIA